jgi:hypothetical protein
MKVAMVKQVLDICGPWSSVRWRDTTPEGLFDFWPARALYWEIACLFQADWFIIPQQQTTDYTRWAVLNHTGHEELVRKYTRGVVEPREIPFDDYDLVITIDAILDVPSGAKPLFAYYAAEHKDRHYVESRQTPLRNYDLFLDHMMEASGNLKSLPQAIAFPYLHDLDTCRSLFGQERDDVIAIDWRTLTTLTLAGIDEPWSDAAEAAAKRVEEVLGLPLRFGGNVFRGVYGVNDPPHWGDARHFLETISNCKYYVSGGRISGAGQGVPEAATLGCICIGQKDKVYHRMICHPDCLSESLIEMPKIVRRIVNSPDKHEEILAWQERALREDFVRKPIAILEEAIRWKAGAGAGPVQSPDELRGYAVAKGHS